MYYAFISSFIMKNVLSSFLIHHCHGEFQFIVESKWIIPDMITRPPQTDLTDLPWLCPDLSSVLNYPTHHPVSSNSSSSSDFYNFLLLSLTFIIKPFYQTLPSLPSLHPTFCFVPYNLLYPNSRSVTSHSPLNLHCDPFSFPSINGTLAMCHLFFYLSLCSCSPYSSSNKPPDVLSMILLSQSKAGSN